MKKDTVTKQDVKQCLEVKKIYINIVFFASIYLALVAIGIVSMLLWEATFGAIFTALATIIGIYLTVYQIVRVIKLINSYNKLPCYYVKLDKVKLYMNGKISVFAVSVPTLEGAKYVETNAIYKNKDIIRLRNHHAKILHDEAKNRIYIIKIVD